MSTDTDGSQATATAESVASEKYELAVKGVDKFWKWVEKEGIPRTLALDLLSGDEQDEKDPPFHRTLAWFDLFSPEGVKIHATLRGPGTERELVNTLSNAASAAGRLIAEDGWQPADFAPRSAEQSAAVQAQAAQAAPSVPNGGVDAEGIRKIEVDTVLKAVNDSGNLYYLVKGFPWKQYGVRAWPDSGKISKLAALVDLTKWKAGQLASFNSGDLYAIVALKPDGKPLKVIDWDGPKVLSDGDALAIQAQLAEAEDEIDFDSIEPIEY